VRTTVAFWHAFGNRDVPAGAWLKKEVKRRADAVGIIRLGS
jgi:hypothetical protein